MISLLKMKGVNLQTKETIYYPKWTRIATVTETQLAKRMAEGQQDANEGGDTPGTDPGTGGDTGGGGTIIDGTDEG